MLDWADRVLRPALRKTARFALHEANPTGAKIAKRVARARELKNAEGLYFHGGELTKAAAERSAMRRARGTA